MRTKVTLVLVFLNVALFFFIFKFDRAWVTQTQLLEARSKVLGPEAADIRAIEVTSTAPGGSFALARRGDTWWLTKPVEWPANLHAVSNIVNELKLLDHKSAFEVKNLAKNGQSLADYGLDKPKLKVEFRSGESGVLPPTHLELGDITKSANLLYLHTPETGLIHVVERSLSDSLSVPLAQLRSDALLTIPVFEAQSLSIRTATGAAPITVRRDGTRWTFETPIIARASKLEIDLAINDLNALRAANFNPATPPATPPAAAPVMKVTLQGNNRRETLLLGETIGSTAIPAGAATAPDVEVYAQLEGRSALFTVAMPARLLEKLRNAQDTLREKRVLDLDNRTVTSITIAAPNQPPLTLQRDPAAPADSPWQVVWRADATAQPQTLAADPDAIKRLLQQLGSLAATKFQSDAPTAAELENWGFNRPERVVTLALAAGAGAPAASVELQLGTDARQAVYARLAAASSSIYAVDFDFARELQFTPRAWRDRLVHALPQAAKITALKLADLEGNATLLDLTFDAAGNPKPETADAKAVAIVLAQLRTLRAQRFVQDGFTDKVLFAGDERGWKYKLDATVSLPGGAGGEQTSVRSLLLSVRGGGREQLAGDKEANAVFEVEQAFLDALWKLTPPGTRDPGVPAPAPKN